MTTPRASATTLASDAVLVQWQPVDNATQYRVSRGLLPTGPFVSIGVVTDGQTGLRDTGLVPSTWFHYRIEAMGSPPDQAVRRVQPTAPPLALLTASAMTAQAAAPTGFVSCPGSSGNCGSWQLVPGAAYYVVQVKYMAGIAGCQYLRKTTVAPNYQTSCDPCPQKWSIAAVFQMKDFPTPGATFEKEGPPAFVSP